MAFQDIMTISTVSFHPFWGDKAANLRRILGYVEAAARAGSDLVVLPEMALTGYDLEPDLPREELMPYRLAEPIDGPAVQALSKAARDLSLYVMCGMPLRDVDAEHGESKIVIYNALICATPSGEVHVYRKMHLPDPEPRWATRGSEPLCITTPWGPLGVGICYDSYRFPELSRYYAAKGCRIYVNATAHAHCHGRELADKALEVTAIRDGIFVVTANLCGKDRENYFYGGGSIIGPSQRTAEAHYYAGLPFLADGADEEGIYTATVDLALAHRSIFCHNPAIGDSDWRPDIYRRMLDDVLTSRD